MLFLVVYLHVVARRTDYQVIHVIKCQAGKIQLSTTPDVTYPPHLSCHGVPKIPPKCPSKNIKSYHHDWFFIVAVAVSASTMADSINI